MWHLQYVMLWFEVSCVIKGVRSEGHLILELTVSRSIVSSYIWTDNSSLLRSFFNNLEKETLKPPLSAWYFSVCVWYHSSRLDEMLRFRLDVAPHSEKVNRLRLNGAFLLFFFRCSHVVRSPSSPVWPTCLTASPRRRRKSESSLPRNSSHDWEKKMVGIATVWYCFVFWERVTFPLRSTYWNAKMFRLLIFDSGSFARMRSLCSWQKVKRMTSCIFFLMKSFYLRPGVQKCKIWNVLSSVIC